jgi:hypothetical protein
MTTRAHPLEKVNLGDIVSVGDGRRLTVRARAVLPDVVGLMAGFVLCGELEALLSVPPSPTAPVGMYAPLNYVPAPLARATPVYAGAVSYWAPHLHADGGAMGELTFRVAEVPGILEPLVIVWRGKESVVFCHYGDTNTAALDILAMPAPSGEVDIKSRRSDVVSAPHTNPGVPEHAPAQPVSAPARVFSRRFTRV